MKLDEDAGEITRFKIQYIHFFSFPSRLNGTRGAAWRGGVATRMRHLARRNNLGLTRLVAGVGRIVARAVGIYRRGPRRRSDRLHASRACHAPVRPERNNWQDEDGGRTHDPAEKQARDESRGY